MKWLMFLMLCSCAVGVVDPLPAEENEPQKQLPPPVPEPETSNNSDCVVNRYRVNNCFVTEVICQENLKRLDISCDRGRELFPWEYVPDPPYSESHNE